MMSVPEGLPLEEEVAVEEEDEEEEEVKVTLEEMASMSLSSRPHTQVCLSHFISCCILKNGKIAL